MKYVTFVSLTSLYSHMNRCLHCTFDLVSDLTCTFTSISIVAQAADATEGPLSVNTVSIHMAIVAAYYIAFVDILITNRMVLNQINISKQAVVANLEICLVKAHYGPLIRLKSHNVLSCY